MAGTASLIESYAEPRAAALSAARGEPAWLRERRAEAARAFAATPMPTPRLRPWRYTDLSGLDLTAYPPSDTPIAVKGVAPAGGFSGTLAEALAAREELMRGRLGSVITGVEGKFQAANAAFWTGGVLVHVPRGAVPAEPIEVMVDASALSGAAVFPRLLIVAEERAEATVIVRFVSGDEPLLVAGVVEVVAEQAAQVRLLLDVRWGTRTQDFTTVRSTLARDADVRVGALALGGELVKQTIEALIEGEGAHSGIGAVALGDRGQHFDFVTLQDHVGPRTTSDVKVKAALAGSSRSIYYGLTRVEETAAGAEAGQVNNNLLLSDNAKADSDPVLEILTAQVIRCGHGATVGPVDAGELFYLQSRGLDRRTALQLLVNGFFQAVVSDLGVPGVADEVEQAVVVKLATAEL
jgi:Fe-S cluster assembly protein SufD